jgi:GTP-binding protein
MKIDSLTFVKSSPDLKSCPADRFPEYAFAGRSNVENPPAESSDQQEESGTKLLNSRKTRLINHFLSINAGTLSICRVIVMRARENKYGIPFP